MKLFYSASSPFVRKVLISAMACGLDERITRVTTDPWSSPPDLTRQNPLSKVPCLGWGMPAKTARLTGTRPRPS